MLITYRTESGPVTVLASTITRLAHIDARYDQCGERTIVETSKATFVALETALEYEANLQIWRSSLQNGGAL